MSGPDPPEYDFDRAVRLTPTGSPDMSLADLPASWTVHGGPMNGGITLAVAANALSARLNQMHGHPDPLCVSAFFLSAADPGPAQVRTEVIRSSRSMSTATASIIQPDATGTPLERLRVTGTFADLDAAPPHVLTVARPPHLPAPEECFTTDTLPASPLDDSAVMQRYEMRIDPATAGWFEGTPTGLGHMRAWFRMRDGRAPSTIMLLQVVDALPPVAYDLGVCGWVPTLELTVHVRAKPAPGWLRISTSSVNFASGFLEEDAEVWDSADRLVAQARQLAKVAATPSAPASHGWVV